jgi:RNA polymerase sigma-70 factor (ECF subfamily)
MGGADDAVPIAELLEERRYLLDVAYWMLGSGSEAEDVVAEVYRRWYELPESARAGIGSPRAWLAKAAGGVCLDRLALPGRGEGGAGGVEERLFQEVGGVLLGALDALSPVERAAFVLNDVFGMTPGAVADIVGQSEPECVELAERARRSVRARRERPQDAAEHDAVARRVRQACVAQDAGVLASLLAPDVTAFFDGGGKVRALVEPVHGSERVARSLLGLLGGRPRTTVHAQSVNGRTGLVVRYDRQVAAVIGLDVTGDRVAQVWVILNPDKLRSWNRTDVN